MRKDVRITPFSRINSNRGKIRSRSVMADRGGTLRSETRIHVGLSKRGISQEELDERCSSGIPTTKRGPEIKPPCNASAGRFQTIPDPFKMTIAIPTAITVSTRANCHGNPAIALPSSCAELLMRWSDRISDFS
jgi:hypothetical protein